MNKKLLPFLCLLYVLLTCYSAKATHIVGGELNYKNLGSNNYEIRLTVYRDCYVGVPPFDNPAYVGIFNSSNQLLQTLTMTFRGLDTLPPTINDPCTIPPLDFCYEVTTYIDTINLPPLAGGYQISYQRCCRNVNILNIVNPSCVGATYYATIPGPEVVAVNSNPVIKFWPPPFICVDKPWIFDDSAIDYDGDSLVYELFMPYDGLTPDCPIVTLPVPSPAGTSCPNTVAFCPPVPVSPPFNTIIWQGAYSTANMLGGVPMQINTSTGIVTATPNTQGYFVIGIKVKEYRNGVFLSETKRDFQLIVKPCPSAVVAAAQIPQNLCGTTTATFINTSSGSSGLNYNWNFGDLTTLADTSHLTSPSYNYPGLGTYTVSLIASLVNKPLCKDTAVVTISVYPKPNVAFATLTDTCSNLATFVNQSTPLTDIFNWYINSASVSTQTTTSYSFNNAGTYTISLIAQNTYGCKDTLDQIIVIPVDSAAINPPKTKCINTSVNLLANGGDAYSWQPSTGLSSTTISNPVCNTTISTIYTVTITQNSVFGKVCIKTLTTSVNVVPIDSARFNFTVFPCTDSVRFINNSISSSSLQTIFWNFNGGNLPNSLNQTTQTYSVNGTYTVSLLTINAFGCRDSIVKPISVFNFTNAVVSNDTICRGFSSQLNASGGTSYTWSPVTSLSNPNIQNPIATPNTTTTYSVLIVNNSSGNFCSDTLKTTVVVNPKINAAFNYTIGACGNNVQFTDASFNNPASWDWDFGDMHSSILQNPLYYYGSSNTYTATLISTNIFGCKDTVSQVISLPPFTPISVSNSVAKCETDTVQLIASGGVYYSWSPSQALSNANIYNPIAFPSTTTIYTVTISSINGTDTCKSDLTTTVNIFPFAYNSSSITVVPSTLTLGQSSNVTLNGFPVNSTITVVPDAHVVYTGNNTFAVTPTKSGEYTIYAIDENNCRHTLKTIYVEVITDECNEGVVYLPTGFTPNSDGVNDILFIRSNFITEVYLTIYDRWGEKTFETDTITKGWDGTFKGKQLDQGVYGYYMTFKCNNGNQSFKKGNITLMR
jgi:gliding motility-associated-like protein